MEDIQIIAKELTKLQVVSRELLRAVEDLEGVEMPYPTARLLAVTADAVRVVLGERSRIEDEITTAGDADAACRK
jgi:hypothetical protein